MQDDHDLGEDDPAESLEHRIKAMVSAARESIIRTGGSQELLFELFYGLDEYLVGEGDLVALPNTSDATHCVEREALGALASHYMETRGLSCTATKHLLCTKLQHLLLDLQEKDRNLLGTARLTYNLETDPEGPFEAIPNDFGGLTLYPYQED